MAIDTEVGIFLPTTDIFDRALIDQIDVNSSDFKDFLVRLYQTTNNIALVTNIKDSGYYVESEFVTGQLWFENKALSSFTPQVPDYRQGKRKVIIIGALPNAAGTKTVAHGIIFDVNTTFVRQFCNATNSSGFISRDIPYASATANEIIEMWIDATNVNIKVGKDQSAFDRCQVVIEFLRN